MIIVVSLQIMNELDSLDSYRDLQPIRVKKIYK